MQYDFIILMIYKFIELQISICVYIYICMILNYCINCITMSDHDRHTLLDHTTIDSFVQVCTLI